MFGRSFSFWQRLVGRTPEASTGLTNSPEFERRVWVRYPADLETTLQAENGAGQRFSARVRDISRGGVSLIVNRTFQPGDLLSVELPVADDQAPCTVLACIVRVEFQTGEWTLGCIFSRELEDDDLQGLGARREKHSDADQRTWMRFPCQVKATFQPVGTSEGATRAAQVLNISANGVGLLVQQPVDMGALITVDLLPLGRTSGQTMLACVVHTTTQGPNQWALGCNFIRELSETDLQALV